MQTLFFILGAVALISGGLVVFQKHPLRSALWLIVNFLRWQASTSWPTPSSSPPSR
jgi:NADH:ubiquinone oxidoreductase subunit 6 (subunit J)